MSSVKVPATTLDEFCSAHQISKIDYLKLDVEGAEILALQGARELLARKAIRYLQFEISKNMLDGLNTTARRIFDYLGEWGYVCHTITPEGTLGEKLADSSAFYENYVAVPGVSTGDTAIFQSLGLERIQTAGAGAKAGIEATAKNARGKRRVQHPTHGQRLAHSLLHDCS